MRNNVNFIHKSFRNYLIPSILAILGGNFSIMIDNVIAGLALGENALAAMSMINPIFFVLTTVGVLVNGGASTVASVCIGRGEQKEKNILFSWSVYLSLGLGIVVSAAGLIFLKPLLGLMRAEGELYRYIYDYCLVLLAGGISIIAVYLPLNFFRIAGKGKMGSVMFMIMAGADIVLDLLFLYVFGMGMKGMALATVLSSLIAVMVCAPFLFRKESGYRLVGVLRETKLLKNIFAVGRPFAMNNFYSMLRTFFLNNLLLSAGGNIAVAGFSFANSINTLAQAVVSGISQTIPPLAGVFFGERDLRAVKSVIALAMKVGVLTMLAYAGVLIFLSDFLCGLFGMNDPMQKKAAVSALLICSVSLVGAVINNVFMYYYITVDRIRLASHITLLRGLLYLVPVSFLLSKTLGTNGVWIAFSVCELLTFLTMLLETKYIRRKDAEIQGILLLNMDEYEKGNVLTFSVVNNEKDITESAQKVSDFCEDCELLPKQVMMLSLSIEEILILMKDHVFREGQHEMEVRIFIGVKDVIMRIRCEGMKFNPLTYYKEELEKENDLDTGESLGLNMIKKAAKKIEYTTNLGMNNIVIVI